MERSKKQEVCGSTYYSIKEIDYSSITLNVNATAFQIQNQIRAFCFRPYQLMKWKKYDYVECKILNKRSKDKPGTIYEDTEIHTIISTIDYDVKLYKDVLEKILRAIELNNNAYAISLCESKKIINAQDKSGKSPLTVAVENGNEEMIDFLISRGADLHVKDWNGTNLLEYATYRARNYGDWVIFRKLIELGLDISETNYSGISVSSIILDLKRTSQIPIDIDRIIDVPIN